MKYIDIDTWKRKQQYLMFKDMELPYFNICSNVDALKLKELCRKEKISFSKCIMFIITKIMNEIPELRTRIRKEGIVEHKKINLSFTVLSEDDLFGFVRTEYTNNFQEFYKNMKEGIKKAKDNITPDFDADLDSDYYLTTVPWISFTSIQHPMHIKESDCIPRISVGKYFEDKEKLMLPVSFQAHHGLVDGVHAGKFYMKLEEALKNPYNYLELKNQI